MEKYILWLDDNIQYRNPNLLCPDSLGTKTWRQWYFPKETSDLPLEWAKNYSEFVEIIERKGLPVALSFDNDLGEEKEGVDCARWLLCYCIDNELEMPHFRVHSANPICAKEIKAIVGDDLKNTKN